MQNNIGSLLRAQVLTNQKPFICAVWPLFGVKGVGGTRAQEVKILIAIGLVLSHDMVPSCDCMLLTYLELFLLPSPYEQWDLKLQCH